ncbi:hypothetical protein [Nostoc sp.]|uniref:hypothetical protein n=1 Tax=Nostoc sp. TaxID=1180 RepID=UPI002FF9B28F
MLEIPPEIENQIKRWHRDAVILHSIFITLGVTSILSSLIVATFVEELGNFRTKVFAAISAGSVGIINTTGVGRKGNGFRQAQRHLKAETIRFSAGKSSIGDLAKAFAEAESMIGDVEIKIRDSSNS